MCSLPCPALQRFGIYKVDVRRASYKSHQGTCSPYISRSLPHHCAAFKSSSLQPRGPGKLIKRLKMTSSPSPTCNNHTPHLSLRTSGTAHWFPRCLILSSHVFLGLFFLNDQESSGGKKVETKNGMGGHGQLRKGHWWCCECIPADGLWVCQQAQAWLCIHLYTVCACVCSYEQSLSVVKAVH